MLRINSDSQPSSFMRQIKSFVCRNRKLTSLQQELVDQYYPLWGLPNNRHWNFEEIFQNNNDVILEIGFGTGETLIKNAVANPDYNFIGIEVYQAGCLNILDYIKQNNITNLRVCNGDAQQILLHYVDDKSLAGMQIFFPDPWPKLRHHKRRLIQSSFVALLAKKIKPSGFLHLATDWEDYAMHMSATIGANPDYIPYDQQKSNEIAYLATNKRLLTRFEQKGLQKGYKINDLFYKIA